MISKESQTYQLTLSVCRQLDKLTDNMATVYSIATQKGGTGKTSTSISLSAGLARNGKRVLLIDIDAQANASKVLLRNYQQLQKSDTLYVTIIEKKPLRIQPSGTPNLDIVPGHILLSDTDMALTTAIDHRESRLAKQLRKVKDQYDFVIIDCPPSLGWQTINALTASDYVIVVIEPGYFELDSTVQFSKTVNEVRENFNPDLAIRGYLFTKSDPTNNSKISLKLLRDSYPNHVLNTVIPRTVDMKDANATKKDIFGFNPHSKAAEAYRQLIQEVFV
jgi:chromosome partitioning protein